MDIHILERPLDEENWIEFRQYTQVIEHIRPFLIDYLALSADFQAVTCTEEQIGAELTRTLDGGMISIPAGVDANARAQQLVSNFLSAASAFRDRAASRVSRKWGHDSSEGRSLKAKTSQLFDSSFAYRLMYALRNYAQHHELPISLVPINAERCADGSMIARVSLHLHPMALAESDRLSSKIRAELHAVPASFLHLMPLLTEFMIAHQSLMAIVLGFFSTPLEEMAHYAAAVYRTFEVPHDAVPVVWEGDDPAEGPHTQERFIPRGFDEMVRAFRLRDELRSALANASFCNSFVAQPSG